LANPSLANVPSNQVRYFEQFVQDNKLSKRLYTPTRKGVLVPVADIDNMIVRDGKVVSTIDYSEVNAQTHKEISESFMSETFASAPETIEFSQDGEVYKTRLMLPMKEIFFMNLYIDLPEDALDYSEEQQEAVAKRENLMRNGFYYVNAEGEESHAAFFMRTPSQARQLQGIFIDTSFMSPVEALKALGNELVAYAKLDDKGNYILDVDKMITRPGLAGTNTVASKT